MWVSLKISGRCGVIRHVGEIFFFFKAPSVLLHFTLPAVTKLSTRITSSTPAQVIEPINLPHIAIMIVHLLSFFSVYILLLALTVLYSFDSSLDFFLVLLLCILGLERFKLSRLEVSRHLLPCMS